ncbi:MAG TPA: DUF1579 family protein [Candidatus Acidoferrales bacterium]|nr:DUF1579 family protein [Candidatus Acidoferrales bacterium]
MTQQTTWFRVMVLSAILMIPGSAIAKNKARNRQNAAPARADSTKPGAPHASLAKLAGNYTRVIKFIGQTGAAAAPSSGTAKFSVVLGGRFLLEESEDTVFGRPVGGLRIYGYNNVTKQYEMARMYTMSTGITMMKGTSSDGGKTIAFAGDTDTSGANKMPLHAKFLQIDEDQFRVTLSTVGPDGKESAFQETDYKRKR